MNFSIKSKNNFPDELKIVETVKSICVKYLIPTFTQEIIVESGAIPHSHPILTINTRVEDERLILKTLLHEEFHWYVQNHKNYNDCITYLKTKYEGGKKPGKYPNSYWEHIIVCFNTRNYLQNLLSKEDIDWIYAQWQPYQELEDLIHTDFEVVGRELQNFDMIFSK